MIKEVTLVGEWHLLGVVGGRQNGDTTVKIQLNDSIGEGRRGQ